MAKSYTFVVPSFFCKLALLAGEYILFKIQDNVLHKALLVPFHLQDIVRFLIYDFFRYLLLGPMASIVTTQPFRHRMSSSSGMALI